MAHRLCWHTNVVASKYFIWTIKANQIVNPWCSSYPYVAHRELQELMNVHLLFLQAFLGLHKKSNEHI